MKKKMQEEEKISKGEETDNKEFTNSEGNNQSGSPEQEISASKSGSDSSAMGIEETADKVVSEIRAIEEKLAETQDKYLRLSAEFDNYRRRTLKEKMEMSKYAEENLLSKIIPFMDDFERALKHIETSDQNIEAIKNGIDLIYLKFSEFLKQNGVKVIEAAGSDFNVDLHEAVAKVQVDEPEKKGKVVDVALKGYYLHDKVLRFAKVVVGE